MKRVLVDPYRHNIRLREFSQFIESEMPYKVDFSVSATARGTSASSVAWSSEGEQTLTIANKALSSGVASADVTGDYSGFGLLKVVCTYADGNTETVYIKVTVNNPEEC